MQGRSMHPSVGDARPLAVGTPVSVRASAEGRWCGGYEVAGALFDDQGVASYRLHRIGDEEHLAVLFPVGDVIPDGPVSVQRRRRPSSAAGR